MKKIKKTLLKLAGKLLLAAFGFFAVTFLIYFFNLDMKLTSVMEPVLNWFYDRVDRNTHL